MALTKITSDIVESNIQQSGYKNKIIGGDFSTNPWQRGVTFGAVADNTYTADRWVYKKSTDSGIVSILKTQDAPTASQAGIFTQHCLDVDVTAADISIATGEYSYIEQRIEGINSMSLGFGQAGARFVSLSFWHKHTKTGSYSVSLSNSASNRSYVAAYTQDASNVWEKSEITIPVDTSGTWLYDNGIGLRVRFCIASGSTFQTTSGSWVAGDFLATSAQVNGLDNVNNNFKIALVQLEYGNASMFEARSIGQEISLSKRYFDIVYYFLKSDQSNGTTFGAGYNYAVVKRSSPTLTIQRWSEVGLQTAPYVIAGLVPTIGHYIGTQATSAIAAHSAEGVVLVSSEL